MKKKLIGARQKNIHPFSPRFEKRKSEFISTKKVHFAENFSFAFDIFEACLIFDRLDISRSKKVTSKRTTLQMK